MYFIQSFSLKSDALKDNEEINDFIFLYKYVGSVILREGGCQSKIHIRIGMENTAMVSLAKI